MKSTPKEVFGKKLRELRISAGVTQLEIAAGLGYSTAQFISNWERGISLPPVTAFTYLAKLFHIRPQAFAEWVWETEDEEKACTRRETLRMVLARSI